jgi:hypothetical protein
MTLFRLWTYISNHFLSFQFPTPCKFRPGKELTVLTEREKVGLKIDLHVAVK